MTMVGGMDDDASAASAASASESRSNCIITCSKDKHVIQGGQELEYQGVGG